MPSKRTSTKITAALVAALAAGAGAQATEYGLSVYQLGLVLPSPGYTPPPGVYFWDTFFYYDGSGPLHQYSRVKDQARVSYQFIANIGIFAWYTDVSLFGGDLGFATTNAIGSDRTTVANPYGFAQQTVNGFADTQLTALLGWRSGDNHWKLTVSGFIPTGNYDATRIAQMSLNRPALDVKGAYTYINHENGLEASGALGFTFNAINSATDYLSGSELHFEWAVGDHLPSGLYLGVGGYFYQQITPDSGAGAIYGSFQGRVAGVGPVIAYRFTAGGQQVDFNARWYREFGAYNRVQGDTIFATLGFPLWQQPAPILASR